MLQLPLEYAVENCSFSVVLVVGHTFSTFVGYWSCNSQETHQEQSVNLPDSKHLPKHAYIHYILQQYL